MPTGLPEAKDCEIGPQFFPHLRRDIKLGYALAATRSQRLLHRFIDIKEQLPVSGSFCQQTNDFSVAKQWQKRFRLINAADIPAHNKAQEICGTARPAGNRGRRNLMAKKRSSKRWKNALNPTR
jgi:hypothetical protein